MFYIAAIPTDERFAEEFFYNSEREDCFYYSNYTARFGPHANHAFQFRTKDAAEASLKRWAANTDPYVWRDFEIREA